MSLVLAWIPRRRGSFNVLEDRDALAGNLPLVLLPLSFGLMATTGWRAAGVAGACQGTPRPRASGNTKRDDATRRRPTASHACQTALLHALILGENSQIVD